MGLGASGPNHQKSPEDGFLAGRGAVRTYGGRRDPLLRVQSFKLVALTVSRFFSNHSALPAFLVWINPKSSLICLNVFGEKVILLVIY